MSSETPFEAIRVVPASVIHARNDVDAKVAFVRELHALGFDARVTRSPADITATKDGVTYFFEIKKTSQPGSYFGAATLTEWEAAIRLPDHYFFVTAQVTGEGWVFHRYRAADFMKFSTIPPFKVFFQVPVGAEPASAPVDRQTKSIRLTEERVREMAALYDRWRADDAREASE